MKYKTILVFIGILSSAALQSCDYLEDDPIQLTGNIYLINNPTNPDGWELFLKDSVNSSFYVPIGLGGYIREAFGNDYVLYAMENNWNNKQEYYVIYHKSGKQIIRVKKMDSLTFHTYNNQEQFPYYFIPK